MPVSEMTNAIPPLVSYEINSAENGFSPDADIFGRKSFADRLTRVLQSAKTSITIALDAPWGEGKSTFLKMWKRQLSDDGFPVILIDAFATDHFSSPLVAFAGSISEFVRVNELHGATELSKKVIGTVAGLSRATPKLIARAIVHFGLGNSASEAVEEVESSIADALGDVAEKVFENEAAAFASEAGRIKQLHEALGRISESYMRKAGASERKPLIILIDELDRCRPDFAIEYIEAVKHFFAAADVHFVCAVNLAQLEAAAKNAFGESCDARVYLEKFFRFSIKLPSRANWPYPHLKHASARYMRSLMEEASKEFLIPTLIEDHAWAQSRNPMDMMRQGSARSLFQARQQ